MGSHRAKKRRSCQGKKRYPTREEARSDMFFLLKNYPGQRLDVYRCRFCGAYHVGHLPAAIRKIIDDRRNR